MKVLIINGVNLGLLGSREVDIYGQVSFDNYLRQLKEKFSDFCIDYIQTDKIEEIVNQIHNSEKYDGIILNPGAFTHTSIILADAVKSVATPVIEVHISNLFGREQYRKNSCLSGCCQGFISGFGLKGYELALYSFMKN